jgi:hypothetical protein
MKYFTNKTDSETLAFQFSLGLLPDNTEVNAINVQDLQNKIAEGIEFARELLDEYISNKHYTKNILLNELDAETESNSDLFEEILEDEFIEAEALRERIA